MKFSFIIISLLFTSFAHSLNAQGSINFSAGINSSDIALNERADIPFGSITESVNGYFIEVGPSYQLTEKIEFRLNTQISQKGFRYNERSFDKSIWRITYLDFIPEFEYSLFKFLSLGLGVNYGIKLNAATKPTNQDPWIKSDSLFEEKTDFGIAGKLKLEVQDFYLFTRINRGRRSLADLSFTFRDGQPLTTTRVFNKNFQYGIGYTLKL